MNLHFREAGSGQPLLILHGLFGSCDNWATLAKQLAANYHVFIIDQRNHGQSPHSNEWNYTAMANDIEDFCEQHQLEKIFIAGHSMGGKTVMKLAELFPERISKMMIIDIAPRYYPIHHHTIIAALQSLNFNTLQTRKQAEVILTQSIDDFGTRQFLLKNIYRTNHEKFAWRFNLEVITNNIEIVGEATPNNPNKICFIPTAFVKGALSDYIAVSDEQDIPQLYPNAQIISIAGAGHWVHAEKPAELLEVMLHFFV